MQKQASNRQNSTLPL